MATTLTGTPVAWSGGSINVPSDATAVYLFWSYKSDGDGYGVASVALGAASPSQTYEIPTASGGGQSATGVAAWYNPATGSVTPSITLDGATYEGPATIFVFTKDGDTTAWRDADAAGATSTTPVTVTVTTVSGDLVIKFDAKYSDTAPTLSSGWTSAQTQVQNVRAARASYISASGSSQVCDSEGETNSTIVAISIPSAGGSATAKPALMNSMLRRRKLG